MLATQEPYQLKDFSLFNKLPVHQLLDVEAVAFEKSYKKNDFVFMAEDKSNYLFLVKSGRVKTGMYSQDGKEILKGILGSGEIFGEMALIEEERSNQFAQTIDDGTTIYVIPIEKLQSIMQNNPSMGFKITQLLAKRVKKAEKRIESLIFKNARSRIVDFIKDMANERGRKVGFETMVANHLTHMDIANLTATSRQTVTTVLNDLRYHNLIYFDRKRILIRDMDKLK